MQQSMANLYKIKRMVLPGLFPPFAHARKPRADAAIVKPVLPGACQAVDPLHRAVRPLYFQAPELGRLEQLLDLGGGPGRVASLLKEERPGLKVTVFDLPPVCHQALELFRERGQQEDLGAHPGNLLTDPLPSGFDAMQFSHVLELFSAETILLLLRKAHDGLPRGGKLVIYGHADNDERRPPVAGDDALGWPARFGAPAAKTYSVGLYQRWLRAVGFSKITARHDGVGTFFLLAIK